MQWGWWISLVKFDPVVSNWWFFLKLTDDDVRGTQSDVLKAHMAFGTGQIEVKAL